MGIKTFVFQIDPLQDVDLIWENLESMGCLLLYSDSEENTKKIFGHLPTGVKKEDLLNQFPEIITIKAIELPDIDWEAQWAVHENYHDGFVHIDLNKYYSLVQEMAVQDNKVMQDFDLESLPLGGDHSQMIKTASIGSDYDLKDCVDFLSSTAFFSLKLIPGPGFGDLSHPTTRLMLKLMGPYMKEKSVIDVGCGSGILSLASISMGAKEVLGIDIDELALVHAKTNSQINGVLDKIHFCLPEECINLSSSTAVYRIMLMNMIESEQRVAWSSLSPISPFFSIAITSGILKEARKEYLVLCAEWGWTLIEEREEEGWLGFVFSYSSGNTNRKS